MSNLLAIATVTAALQQRLISGHHRLWGAQPVRHHRPARPARTRTISKGVNIFLYQVRRTRSTAT